MSPLLPASPKVKGYAAKARAVLNYVLLHKKQLSAAVALGAALLEAIQKAL